LPIGASRSLAFTGANWCSLAPTGSDAACAEDSRDGGDDDVVIDDIEALAEAVGDEFGFVFPADVARSLTSTGVNWRTLAPTTSAIAKDNFCFAPNFMTAPPPAAEGPARSESQHTKHFPNYANKFVPPDITSDTRKRGGA
jgi:hypothetical protein